MTLTRSRRAIAAIRAEPPRLTWLEAFVIAAVVAVAATGWLALGLAHLGRLDRWTLVTGLLATVAAGAAVVWRWRPPRPSRHASDLVFVVVAALAVALFLPGAPYVAGDKDPGVYVAHGFAIAREGSTDIPDPVLVSVEGSRTPESRFPGLRIDHRDRASSLPQFYYNYPALLAAARLLGGAGAVFQVNPLVAVLAVLAFSLAVRRTFGLTAAVITGTLLSTNMLQVFYAKYPSTEIPSQMLLAGALLLLVTAVRTAWWPAAVAGGAMTTLLFLNHPGGLLLIGGAVILLALGAAGRADSRLLVGWGAGMAFPAGHAAYQAWSLNRAYSLGNHVPEPEVVGVVFAGIAVAGAVTRRLGPAVWHRTVSTWPVLASAASRRRIAGWALTVGSGAMLLFFALREQLLGQRTRTLPNGVLGRSYDEITLERLGFFFTRPGLVLMWLGVVVAAFTVRRTLPWLVLLPGAGLLPLLLWRARVAPRLMWWGRRFIPTAVPLIVVLIALALAWLITRQGRHRRAGLALGLVLTAGMTAAFLAQSVPVARHREWAGSWGFLQQIDDLAGERQAVFLWTGPTDDENEPRRNFGGPLWFVHDQLSATLPSTEPAPADVQAYVDAFPDHEVFVLTADAALPPSLDASDYDPLGRIDGTMTIWEEQIRSRPDEAVQLTQTVWAWRWR